MKVERTFEILETVDYRKMDSRDIKDTDAFEDLLCFDKILWYAHIANTRVYLLYVTVPNSISAFH